MANLLTHQPYHDTPQEPKVPIGYAIHIPIFSVEAAVAADSSDWQAIQTWNTKYMSTVATKHAWSDRVSLFKRFVDLVSQAPRS